VSYEEIIAAITGASDNAVTRRAQARVDAADAAAVPAAVPAEGATGGVAPAKEERP
jgi:D-xylose transport system ATP-binding protein